MSQFAMVESLSVGAVVKGQRTADGPCAQTGGPDTGSLLEPL